MRTLLSIPIIIFIIALAFSISGEKEEAKESEVQKILKEIQK